MWGSSQGAVFGFALHRKLAEVGLDHFAVRPRNWDENSSLEASPCYALFAVALRRREGGTRMASDVGNGRVNAPVYPIRLWFVDVFPMAQFYDEYDHL